MDGLLFNKFYNLYIRLEQKIYGLRVHSMRRAENPYATHLPVLMGLARLIPIQRVLELGAGEYSTIAFLDQQAFPDLERLESYEDDKAWAKRIRAKAAGDGRLSITSVDYPMNQRVKMISDWDVDLVFIDDSLSAIERQATIVAVAQYCQSECCVVVHDFEVLEYRLAARAWPFRYAFTGFVPHVGVLWNTRPDVWGRIKVLDRLIASKADSLEPDDIAGWVKVFDKEL